MSRLSAGRTPAPEPPACARPPRAAALPQRALPSAAGLLRTTLLTVGLLLLAGCLPDPASREGRSISSLYQFVLVLAVIVAAIVWGLLSVAILRYRRRPADRASEAIPPQIGGHIPLEALWTIVPLLTILIIFGLTLVTLDDVEARRGDDPIELHVEAFRWGWRMSYPAEGVAVEGFLDPGPEAVVPVGRPLQITLTSADIIHAFYVPEFLYKRDAIPGHPQVFELTVERAGTYTGQCAEFCGVFHSRMPFSIRAVGESEYEAWLNEQAAGR